MCKYFIQTSVTDQAAWQETDLKKKKETRNKHLCLPEACSKTYSHLPSVCDFVITLGKRKTTCPLLLVLHRCVQLFRVYWTAIRQRSFCLINLNKQHTKLESQVCTVSEEFQAVGLWGLQLFLPLLGYNSSQIRI